MRGKDARAPVSPGVMPKGKRMNTRDTFKLKDVFWMGSGVFGLLVIIAVTGFAVNFVVFLFHAFILGWGDSAPDWYIEIQPWVFYGIFVASAAFWVGGGYYMYARNKRKSET
mgnify:CR=1 FL=1